MRQSTGGYSVEVWSQGLYIASKPEEREWKADVTVHIWACLLRESTRTHMTRVLSLLVLVNVLSRFMFVVFLCLSSALLDLFLYYSLIRNLKTLTLYPSIHDLEAPPPHASVCLYTSRPSRLIKHRTHARSSGIFRQRPRQQLSCLLVCLLSLLSIRRL